MSKPPIAMIEKARKEKLEKLYQLHVELGINCVYRSEAQEPCLNTRRTRGVCHGHYQTMRSYVRLGKADEADLEARGLLLPKGTGGSRITTGHDAFLSGSTVRGEA